MKKKSQNGPQKGHIEKKKQPQTKSEKSNFTNVLGIGIIILLGIIIYSNSFDCSFHFDDNGSIIENTKIRDLSDVKTLWNYSQTRFVAYYTFAINYYFGELDVWGYHLGNLLIHLINACLVFWLTLLIFSSPVLKDQVISKNKKLIAFYTALLFVSHPLATQSVTYIVQRMASLVTLFYLLSLTLYMKARLTDKNNSLKYPLFAGALISAVLAMLTKQNAFTLPFAIVLFEIFFLQTKILSINFKDYRVILVIAIFLGFIYIVLSKFPSSIFNPLPPDSHNNFTNITPVSYLFTQFSVIVKYIQLLILPINQNLDYDFRLSNSFFEIRTILSFLFLISLIILAIFQFKRNRLISFGIFWFFLTLSIESSIIPISDLIIEHRTYLPSFGFFITLSTVIYLLLWNKYKKIAIALLVVIIAVNSILTYERNKVWFDESTLWSDVVGKSPNKVRSLNNRGQTLMNENKLNEALIDFNKAIELKPLFAAPYNNRGIIYGRLGEMNKAIADYTKSIEIDPNHWLAYMNRGIIFGKLNAWDQAIADYTRTIEINPNQSKAFNNRGSAYNSLGQKDEAIADYTKAIEIDPNYWVAYLNRGFVFGNINAWNEAIADYTKAIVINPKNAVVYNNRGVSYINLKRWNKAYADFSKAIELDPNYSTAYSNRDIAYKKLNSGEK